MEISGLVVKSGEYLLLDTRRDLHVAAVPGLEFT